MMKIKEKFGTVGNKVKNVCLAGRKICELKAGRNS
jgi:hypothetical protein